ncbi:hypothetical protein BG006_002064 [Podila minutissima]|uniref:Kelch repeat-containing protein n=1 Tax=Podila minutissima TaxID=64525 RepID=A0A9P5SBV2_9FUNG|nr:hypothetical protein BG006_002064 [Podila minutissima]
MLSATSSKSGKQIVFGGNRDYLGTLSYIYDVTSRSWTTTPNIPGMETSMAGYKRSNIGMQLDPTTGLVYMYGGFQYRSFSNEINVLNTSDPDPSKAHWTVTKNQTTIPALYEPFVLYLPSREQTLVLAGCDNYNNISGLAGSCAPLNVGYLISNGTSNTALQIKTQKISNGPSPRYQACRVVLRNGNVFVHGGRDPNNFFGDAWVLNIDSWVWHKMEIQGPTEAMTRAGHNCEMGPHDQIIIVGEAEISRYVQPYVAVIDTKTWTWKTSFRGGDNEGLSGDDNEGPSGGDNEGLPGGDNEGPSGGDNEGLSGGDNEGPSGGAKAGIVIGALAAIALFGTGALFCFRKRKNGMYFSTAPSFALPTFKKKETKTEPTSRVTTKESRSSTIESGTPLQHHSLDSHSPYATSRPQAGTRGAPHGGEESLSAQTTSGVESQYLSLLSPNSSFTSTAPSTHTQHYPQLYNTHTSSDNSIALMPLQSPHVSIATNQDSGSSATNSTVIVTRINTVHTPILTPARGFDTSHLSGPQSVPESDALIERSSPGVRTHFVSSQDLDGDGLYLPLTPSTKYASSSIVIGVPPHLSSTISTGSMPGFSRYHEGSNTSVPGSPSAPSKSMSYRDKQKERDLYAIIQRMESEGRLELQGPHAVVQSEPEVEEHKVEVDEKGKQVSTSGVE